MDDTKLCTKLTDAHIFARKIKVSHMNQVFSHQVNEANFPMEKVILGSTFATIITFLILDIDSEFILFIDQLF
jgi:hypothetical protein